MYIHLSDGLEFDRPFIFKKFLESIIFNPDFPKTRHVFAFDQEKKEDLIYASGLL